ncbi:MAG: hypothetical protein ABL995_12110 [Bryobacteraceae bacterium]
MALLTDGSPNDTEALRVYETAILSVANVEGIDLDAKLALATEEVSQDVLDILLDHSSTNDPLGSARRSVGVSDVAVTAQLKRWHALHTLEIVYRDAYNNQLNDRYQSKWDEYRELARSARELTMRFGIGLVNAPIPVADRPTLGSVAGVLPGTTYYARVSWVTANGQEGLPSSATTFATPDGGALVVTAVNAPPNVTGWNVYIGLTDAGLMKQNIAPLTIGSSFTVPPGGVVTGAAPGNGQGADVYVTGGRLMRRG